MLVLCLILLADGASAQAPEPEPDQKPATELSQLTLQELTELKIDSVYGASRYTQKVTEAPASVTIVTREEIRKVRAHDARRCSAQRAGILRHLRSQL